MHGLFTLLFAAQLGAGMPAAEDADIAWISKGRFCEPETVLPLPDGTLLVSNVCDFRTTGNGFLSLLADSGDALDWRIVEKLDAPLGMALVAGLLHVVDNNQVKIFSWPGYQLQTSIALNTSVANDIAVADDRTIYVTDTAQGAVTVITPDGKQSLLTGSAQFKGANGIHIKGTHLYVGGERLWQVDLADNSISTIGPEWLADIDGIEMEPDDTLQVTPVGGPLVRLGSSIEILGGDGVSSANHGFAPSVGLALIPTGYDNTVIAIRVHPRKAAPQN